MSVGRVRLQHLFVFSGDDDINLAGGPSKFVTDVAVDHTGKCSWGGPATFKVSCRMKIDLWPFDQQECQLAFGSFSYGENLLKLNLFKDQSNFASKEFKDVPRVFKIEITDWRFYEQIETVKRSLQLKLVNEMYFLQLDVVCNLMQLD